MLCGVQNHVSAHLMAWFSWKTECACRANPDNIILTAKWDYLGSYLKCYIDFKNCVICVFVLEATHTNLCNEVGHKVNVLVYTGTRLLKPLALSCLQPGVETVNNACCCCITYHGKHALLIFSFHQTLSCKT